MILLSIITPSFRRLSYLKKNLNEIDKIYSNAIKNGAVGGKLTGAGGGGHMLFYCEPKKQKSVKNEMERMGLKHINFKFHQNGAKILNLYDFM